MRVYRVLGIALGLTLLMTSLTGCTIQIPTESTPGASGTQPSSPGSTEDATAAPTSSADLPPQTVAQIRQKDMSFERGPYLKSSDTLAFSDGVMESPGWKPTQTMVNGESVYRNSVGCEAS